MFMLLEKNKQYIAGGSSCMSLSPFECVMVHNRFFLIYERTSSWFMARKLCMDVGAKLALLRSEAILNNLASAIKQHHQDTRKYFIGFRNMDYFCRDNDSEFFVLIVITLWLPKAELQNPVY